MHLEKLFNVLVLGGAALVGACGDDHGEPAGGSGGGSTGAGAGATVAGSGGGGAATAGGQGGGGGATSSGGGAGGDATSAGGAMPACSETPDPADACGCPCCWIADCLNTEACCASFCKLGNQGKGCCGT